MGGMQLLQLLVALLTMQPFVKLALFLRLSQPSP